MPTAYLNIGSNKGNRLARIEQAVTLIEHLCNNTARRSTIIESEPWGYDSQASYFNMGIAIDIDMEPLDLLDSLQHIERTISATPHRDSNGNYIDREIDIDIIAIDNLIIHTPRLIIPHPRMHLREFVLRPMHQLAPTWKHPQLNATAWQLLQELNYNPFGASEPEPEPIEINGSLENFLATHNINSADDFIAQIDNIFKHEHK